MTNTTATFNAVVQEATAAVAARWGDSVAATFRNCFENTLSTTIRDQPDGSAFMLTGDIPAMWLRDSSAQLTPYLHFAASHPEVAELAVRVIRRQLAYIAIDPYANAFNEHPNGHGHHTDRTTMSPWVWERKYEIDSLAYPLSLCADLWRITGRTDHLGDDFIFAARAAIRVWRIEQDHENRSAYFFQRNDGPLSDTLTRDGKGPQVAATGLTWSGFRPSDDACDLGYNIPGNAFAATTLMEIAQIATDVHSDEDLALEARTLGLEIRDAVLRHGVVHHTVHGDVLAYEVDGRGGYRLMDDANAPSLLSLPLFGWCEPDDALYTATRALVLSAENPFYFEGTAASGVGSPHTPHDYIWPIALSIQGLTSTDDAERERLVDVLMSNDAGTHLMHESFHKDDATAYTRPWFSWANAMFCELLLSQSLDKPRERHVVDWSIP